MKTTQIILISLFLIINQNLISQCDGHPDYAPLMALYNATNGPNWINNDGWEEGAAETNCNPCNGWYGVFCVNNRVILLFPTDNNLNGALPQEISDLTQLNSIVLSRNNLSGNIPASIGSMTKLKILVLNDNNLTDTIPSTLGNLNQLEDFDLSNNNLSGCIPESLQNLCNQGIGSYALGGNDDLSTTSWENYCNSQEGICGVSSVSTNHQSKLKVYPNPAKDIIRFNGDTDKIISHVKFTNSRSQIFYGVLNNDNSINISHWPEGVFFCRIFYEDGTTKTIKVIKS